MAKQAYVYSGTDWVPLASEVTNLSNYYTKGEIDILDAPTGLKKIVPASVAVGSGSGSADASGTVTFSGASSVSVNDVFSATYKHYVIYTDLTGVSADSSMYLKLRVSGTDASTNYYYAVPALASSGATSHRFANPATGGFEFGQTDSANNAHKYSGRVELFRPFEAVHTTCHIQFNDITNAGLISSGAGGGYHDGNTSYTGFTIYPSSGNFTGLVKVYGYKD
jgi:hypothetical protein